MKKYRITNLSSFLKAIDTIKSEWNQSELWFRGVSNTKYTQIPSLYRGNWNIDLQEESEIYSQFVRKAKAYINDYHKLKAIDWYIIMQHYGFPTRLIDWTSGSLIALYFAVRNIKSNNTRCVYVIDPFEINNCFHKIEKVLCYDEFILRDFQEINKYLFNVNLPEYPIAMEPPYIDKRIVAQKSCFTIHGNSKFSFEELCALNNLNIAKIEISDQYTILVKEELASAGISESILFPDLEGLAREIIFDFVIE